MANKINKSVAYGSQGTHSSQPNSATDLQIAARCDKVIIITLHQLFNADFLNQIYHFSIK